MSSPRVPAIFCFLFIWLFISAVQRPQGALWVVQRGRQLVNLNYFFKPHNDTFCEWCSHGFLLNVNGGSPWSNSGPAKGSRLVWLSRTSSQLKSESLLLLQRRCMWCKWLWDRKALRCFTVRSLRCLEPTSRPSSFKKETSNVDWIYISLHSLKKIYKNI